VSVQQVRRAGKGSGDPVGDRVRVGGPRPGRVDSDIDLAVQMAAPLGACEKMELIANTAAATGRPIDLIDLRTVGEPLLGQILKHGKMMARRAGMARQKLIVV
jgi:hypothetical protein